MKLPARGKGGKAPAGPPPSAIASLMDVVAMEGGCLKRRDGQWVSLIETEGEFFSLLNESEQDARIMAFGRVLNGLSWPVQVVLIVEPTDLSAYINDLEAAVKLEGDSSLGRLAQSQLDTAVGLTQDVMAETVFLAVTGGTMVEASERAGRLQAALNRSEFKAAACSGERAAQVLSLCYGHTGRFMMPSPDWKTVMAREVAEAKKNLVPPRGKAGSKKNGQKKIALTEERASSDLVGPNIASLDQVLAPAAVIEKPGYLDLGGVYAATLVAVSYPERAGNGWLEPILHFNYGSVQRRVSLMIEPLPSEQVVAEINRKLIDLGVAVRSSARRGRHADVDAEMALEDAELLRQEIARGIQRMFDVTMLVTLISDDLGQLREAVTRLKQEAAGFLLMLRETYLEEQAGFRSTIPIQVQTLRRVRPLPTVPIATTFPFTSGELLHETGDLWGRNLLTGNAVIIDPRRYATANKLLVAQTRSGKSMTIKHLATQALFRADSDVMVIDPSPVIDYQRWTEACGGSYLRFGVGSSVRLNPCEIRLPTNLDLRHPELLDEDLQRPVSTKVAFLKALLELMAYPGEAMPSLERARLEKPLYAMYEKFGMTDDWTTIADRSGLSVKPKAKLSPTLTDVLEFIQKVPELQDLAMKIQPYVEGTLDMFSGQTNADLDNRLVVFNVHQLIAAGGTHLQAVAYSMLMEAIRTRMMEGKRRKIVTIDEAHILFANKDTARFLAALYRMAGKQGGEVSLLTQSITDLVGDPLTGVSVAGEEEARVCLTNTGITFFLRNDKRNDLEMIARIFGLTQSEMGFLSSAQPGQGLVIAGNDRALVQVMPSEMLYWLATTKPEEVRAVEQASAQLREDWEAAEAQPDETESEEPAAAPV